MTNTTLMNIKVRLSSSFENLKQLLKQCDFNKEAVLIIGDLNINWDDKNS